VWFKGSSVACRALSEDQGENEDTTTGNGCLRCLGLQERLQTVSYNSGWERKSRRQKERRLFVSSVRDRKRVRRRYMIVCLYLLDAPAPKNLSWCPDFLFATEKVESLQASQSHAHWPL
jgi:hypothetical protein